MKLNIKSCKECPLYFRDIDDDPRCKYPGIKFKYPDYGLDRVDGHKVYKEGVFFETNKLTSLWHIPGELKDGIHGKCPLRKEELLLCL